MRWLTKALTSPDGRFSWLPRGVVLLMAVSAINVVAGFLREAVIAYHFGTSAQLDAFLVALTVPQVLANQIARISVAVLLPLYIGYVQSNRPDHASELWRRWFRLVALVFLGLCFLLGVGATPLIAFLGPGLSPESSAAAVGYLRWLLPYVYLMALASSYRVILDAYRRFASFAVARTVISCCVIAACFLLASRLGVSSLALGHVFGGAAVIVLVWLRTRPFRPRRAKTRSRPDVTLPIAAAGIMLADSVAQQVSVIIDRGFASTLPEGSVAALNYAHTINAIPAAVVSTAVATALFPVLASFTAAGDWQRAADTARKWVWGTIAVGMVPVLAVILFRVRIVQVLFQRGEFTTQATHMTASVLSILPAMIIVAATAEIVVRLLLAQRRVHVVAVLSLAAVALKFGLNLALVESYGLVGLAWATVLVAAITTTVRYVLAMRPVESTTGGDRGERS